jgi:hypothetical protein
MKPTNHRKLHILQSMAAFALTATLFCSSAMAQPNIAVAVNHMNVLYVGIDNPISVAVSNSDDDKVTVAVSSGEGTVTKTGPGQYNLRVSNPKDELTLNVYADGKLAGTRGFRVRYLPSPTPTIGGRSSGDSISLGSLKHQGGVGCYVKDFPIAVRYMITGFRFNIEDEHGNSKAVFCEGAAFSAEVKQYIDAYAKAGKTIFIDYIRATDEGGRSLKLPSLVYYIK